MYMIVRMSNGIQSENKTEDMLLFQLKLFMVFVAVGNHEFSHKRHQKIAIKRSMEHFSFCLVDDMREMQTNIGEGYVPQWWQLNWHLRLVPEDLPRTEPVAVAEYITALARMRTSSLTVFKKPPSIQFSWPSAGYCWALVCSGSPGQPLASPYEFYLAP